MFCTQCGKKLKDTMLFCPNCGTAIELPDDDEVVEAAGNPEPALRPEIPETPFEAVIQEAAEEDGGDMPSEMHESAQNAESESVQTASRTPEMPPIKRERQVEETVVSVFEDADTAQDEEDEISFDEDEAEFVPLQIDNSDDEPEMVWEKFEPKVERKPPVMRNRNEEAVRLNGRAPSLQGRKERPETGKKAERSEKPVRSARTYVPAKPMDPDDMFMDAEDSYDEFDDMDFDDLPEGDFEYEDDEESSFFLRHIRGIMGFSLMALLALVCVIYVFSETGQVALAKMNLAWNPEVYSKVAYDYYQNGLYDMSGDFYEKALARDEDSYDYAISAASAYIYADKTDKAVSMLKKCIALKPAEATPYIYLANIYPDAASRPWDVSQILQQGYGQTGDDRLKAFAQ